ncbi:MAG TPA: anti-sigma factor [Gemmatimonadales bacterium]|nr:anti-sigma factor [Gemmatimonadales bacterium]
MLCKEFLERHSEYRDGLITSPRDLRRFTRHIAECASCRRYDATVRQAVQVLHAASPITPSADFRQRLDARLAIERRRVPRPPARSGFSTAMLVLAALVMFFFEVSRRPRIEKAPLLPPAAFPKPVASAALPFVSFQDPRASVVNGNPYPYGTALVEPPAITFQPASTGR